MNLPSPISNPDQTELMDLSAESVLILKIYFIETEYLCRMFATKFNKDTDTVLKEGLGKLKQEFPDIINAAIINDDDIKTLNVQQLKDELKARNLRMTGYKKDLQQRLSIEMSRLTKLLT